MSKEKSYTPGLLADWITKAEGDFKMARREFRAFRSPVYDGICFHCQQCVEKYMKAYLVQLEILFPKVHHLPALLDLVLTEQPLWETWRPNLKKLSVYATGYRYPGEGADKQEAKEALTLAIYFRAQLREALGLPK